MRFAIDDGHGMSSSSPGVYDPGAMGQGYKEAEQTYAVGQALRAELVRRGHKVMRPSGDYRTRARQADLWRADALVSLHFNATPGAQGTETFVHPSASARSRAIAAAVQARLPKLLGTRDRGVKTHGWSVLTGKAPAALVEICFIDSATDMRAYKTRGVAAVASTLADALEVSFGLRPKPADAGWHPVTITHRCDAYNRRTRFSGVAFPLYKGQVVTMVGKRGNWVQVQVGAKFGFVDAQFVDGD